MTEPSRKPSQIRNRLRRNVGKPDKIDRDYRMLVEEAGYKPVEEWDWAELAHGRPRDKDGEFKGRKPVWITQKVDEEARRRLKSRVFGELAAHANAAVKVLVDLIKSPNTDDRTRMDAAKLVIAYVLGQPKAALDLDLGPTVTDFLAEALVLPSGENAHPVIDGQFEEDDEPVSTADADRAKRRAVRRKPQAVEQSPAAGVSAGEIARRRRRDGGGFSGSTPAEYRKGDEPPEHLRAR